MQSQIKVTQIDNIVHITGGSVGYIPFAFVATYSFKTVVRFFPKIDYKCRNDRKE